MRRIPERSRISCAGDSGRYIEHQEINVLICVWHDGGYKRGITASIRVEAGAGPLAGHL